MTSPSEYTSLKQRALERYFNRMNQPQRQAVFTINGPVLILAGAGSGKTTVLVNRITNMICFGNAYNNDLAYKGADWSADAQFLEDFAAGNSQDTQRLKGLLQDGSEVAPWQILAITFTNKAAGELRERLAASLGEAAGEITAATFHSVCVRILRREIEHLGYSKGFTIYDSDDSQRVVKTCLSELNISEKQFPPKSIVSAISGAKDKLESPEVFAAEAGGDYRKQVIGKVYALYQSKLMTANAVDFDDIIALTVELFMRCPEVLSHYQNRYKYICVDEYQDTNHAQYKLVSLLSERWKNLCVVGDDDQSIYRFRGATIENILSFEEQFAGCSTIRLEQNYRSTQNILSAANSVIVNNRSRKPKSLWTDSGTGEPVFVLKTEDESGEAAFIADTILNGIKDGKSYKDFAVLYRMNAQSNTIERGLVAAGIPYRVVGGLRFYDRKEIKDIVAYLSFINNPVDILRLKRIINEPKRGIGDATVSALETLSYELKQSPLEVMRDASDYPPLAKKAALLAALAQTFTFLGEKSEEMELAEFFDLVIEHTGYGDYMRSLGDEGLSRVENIEEMKTSILNYQQVAEEPSLGGFLEEISLYTDVDRYDQPTESVTLMTLHSAKGLEFPMVFIVGMEDGIFPGIRSMDSLEDLEEERRLAYVGFTRAKERLFITHAARRMLFGQTSRNLPSRFLKEVDASVLERKDLTVRPVTEEEKSVVQKGRYDLGKELVKQKQQTASKAKAAAVNYEAGERVSHNIFGDGIIVSVRQMAGDAMLEVNFDKVGSKKLMANYAKITKLP